MWLRRPLRYRLPPVLCQRPVDRRQASSLWPRPPLRHLLTCALCRCSIIASVHSGVHASVVHSYPRQHATPATGCCGCPSGAQSAHHDDTRQERLPDTCSAYPAGRSSLANPNWRAAMVEEHDALLKNHSWDLVLRLVWANVSTSSRKMGLLSSIRHAGSFAASLSALAWISRKLSVLW